MVESARLKGATSGLSYSMPTNLQAAAAQMRMNICHTSRLKSVALGGVRKASATAVCRPRRACAGCLIVTSLRPNCAQRCAITRRHIAAMSATMVEPDRHDKPISPSPARENGVDGNVRCIRNMPEIAVFGGSVGKLKFAVPHLTMRCARGSAGEEGVPFRGGILCGDRYVSRGFELTVFEYYHIPRKYRSSKRMRL